MKIFHCDHCGNLLFFENTECVQCNHKVAYLPDVAEVRSLDPASDGTWRLLTPDENEKAYRLCRNYTEQQVCNWAVTAVDSHELCMSCRMTLTVPDLSETGSRQSWYRLEVAKRRVLFTLLRLSLPLQNREEDPQRGLAFEFKAGDPGTDPVLTGHADGVITINIAEADDVEREKQRTAVQERYRTLLGHMRHEIGHYYWYRLIGSSEEIDAFRELFGDERQDYAEALKAHYEAGPVANWGERFVSAYASVHPWEDWAETWAHYLHMVDALETAAACGLSLRPPRADEPWMSQVPPRLSAYEFPFSALINRWFPLTYALNNFNRGLGLPDAYPFILSPAAIAKLQYVHEVISRAGKEGIAVTQRSA
jgi:hypothetical protein